MYLTNMPTDIINEYGLTKTLYTRRETIYLKHIFKNIFIYGNENELKNKLSILKFDLFSYIGFLTNKLRNIYKIPREYNIDKADIVVKQKRNSFFKTLELYKKFKPIIIFDFDKTITNKKFHNLYNYIINDYKIINNRANPNKQIIEQYLQKNNLSKPKTIYSNKGKQKKIIRLKNIATMNLNKIIFYIDDEKEYLDFGVLLGIYCYQYTKQGKIYNYTGFKK